MKFLNGLPILLGISLLGLVMTYPKDVKVKSEQVKTEQVTQSEPTKAPVVEQPVEQPTEQPVEPTEPVPVEKPVETPSIEDAKKEAEEKFKVFPANPRPTNPVGESIILNIE